MKKLPPVRGGPAGCLNCGYAYDLLPVRTMLYYGFGGWTVTVDGRQMFPKVQKNGDVRRRRDGTMAVGDRRLDYFEAIAAAGPRKADWRARYDGPLHEEEYQRQGRGRWVLVRRGTGFA